MATVSLQNIQKTFGTSEVIRQVNLDIEHKDFVVLVGPSGCGKSTLLRLIAGLDFVSSGKFLIDGKDMTDKDPVSRDIAMVFQSYALYPHMSVAENIGFSLKIAKYSKAEIEKRVQSVATMLQLENLLKRKPKDLSGGQRQRVAIGRALVRNPKIFLFDEPLSNLDADLRVQMRLEIARLHKTMDATMIYVTHDQIEAMTLATKIVIMKNGCVEQVGTPHEVYHHPANIFVASFIGSPKMNFLSGFIQAVDDKSTTIIHPGGEAFTLPIKANHSGTTGEPITFGIRPEHVEVMLDGEKSNYTVTVDMVEHLGYTTHVYGLSNNKEPFVFTVEGAGRRNIQMGDKIPVSLNLKHSHLFNEQGLAFSRK